MNISPDKQLYRVYQQFEAQQQQRKTTMVKYGRTNSEMIYLSNLMPWNVMSMLLININIILQTTMNLLLIDCGHIYSIHPETGAQEHLKFWLSNLTRYTNIPTLCISKRAKTL